MKNRFSFILILFFLHSYLFQDGYAGAKTQNRYARLSEERIFSEKSLFPNLALQNQMQAAFSQEQNADPCITVEALKPSSGFLEYLLQVHVITDTPDCWNPKKAQALATLFGNNPVFSKANIRVEVFLASSKQPILPEHLPKTLQGLESLLMEALQGNPYFARLMAPPPFDAAFSLFIAFQKSVIQYVSGNFEGGQQVSSVVAADLFGDLLNIQQWKNTLALSVSVSTMPEHVYDRNSSRFRFLDVKRAPPMESYPLTVAKKFNSVPSYCLEWDAQEQRNILATHCTMQNELGQSMLAPWIVYQNLVKTALSAEAGADPCIVVSQVHEANPAAQNYFLRVQEVCNNSKKALALAQLLHKHVQYGNNAVITQVFDSLERRVLVPPFPGKDKVKAKETILNAFQGNPYFAGIQQPNHSSFEFVILFENAIAQYYADNINDYFSNINVVAHLAFQQMMIDLDPFGIGISTIVKN